MEESLKIFNQQFRYVPEIINKEYLAVNAEHFVLGGMGGSHLHADILRASDPAIDLVVHSSYGLAPEPHVPPASQKAKDTTLFIASSYSGNTEEALDFLVRAHTEGYQVMSLATGGKLIAYAREHNLPYIQIPDTGIQPRSALGYALMALAAVVRPSLLSELSVLSDTLQPEDARRLGEEIAETLGGFVPVIYSSTENKPIAYNWKIKLNETAKVPAFCNVFPELNHNEMQGFDPRVGGVNSVDIFRFVFIRDNADDVRTQKRMDVLEELYEARGFEVVRTYLTGQTYFERVFNSLLLADWVSLSIATSAGVDPEPVPLIEEFKHKIS